MLHIDYKIMTIIIFKLRTDNRRAVSKQNFQITIINTKPITYDINSGNRQHGNNILVFKAMKWNKNLQ